MTELSEKAQELFPPERALSNLGPETTLSVQDDLSEALMIKKTAVANRPGCIDTSYIKALADGRVAVSYDLYDDPDHYSQIYPAGSADAVHLQNMVREEARRRGKEWFVTVTTVKATKKKTLPGKRPALKNPA